ncbi:protein-disulfide reductase DsbD family protein [Telluria mixta]|uniref:Protein-disulfide reductase DsbD family protein n=2 Tax=Telluria mixta TaxID=34071 RepID=A0ABT2BZR2_9BURK|nr:thioredoxin family protein [Telluria mixta]MCS0629884.1 protein-disulfide reductase DsbD family protein [Telluria mixta]
MGLVTAAPAITDTAATAHVRIRLLAAADAVHPGERILFGVEQTLDPEWHTYWINPGETGVPTRIAWDLPAGASAGAIAWPVPERFRTGPVTSYGYAGRATLLSTLTVPQDARPGTTFPVRARVSWLVCKDVCIPQQAEVGLALPVLAVGMPSGAGALAVGPAHAALPAAAPGTVHAATDGKAVALTVAGAGVRTADLEDAWFYDDARGRIAPGAPQAARIDGDRLVVRLRAGEQAGARLTGVLVVKTHTAARGYAIDTALAASTAPIALPEDAAPAADASLPLALLLALLGGLVLNLMPCVFPVLSIKALSLLDHARDDPRTARLHGVAYTLGVLASFALLGVALILLKAGGAQAGWGFQFQSPTFVLATAYLMCAVGLNLSGVFEVGGTLAGVGDSLASRAGYAGSFFTGVLATVVATPCTAPFMGGAVAYALAQPPAVLVAVFLAMGFGLALPYLLLSARPVLQRHLPRPGPWMVRARQAFAFPMYGAAVWLVWVLARQNGVDAGAAALGGMVALAFAAWLYGATRFASASMRVAGGIGAALVVVAALAVGHAGIQRGQPVATTDAGWTPYSAERLQALRAAGKPVFVNLTASWCITCLVNERVALSDGAVDAAFRQAGIAYLKGDWTSQDERITALLTQFGRSGVPLYIFYPGGRDSRPVVLPQLLTPGIVLDTIGTARN